MGYKKPLPEGRVEAESRKVRKEWSDADGEAGVEGISDNRDGGMWPF